jgi:hypothetical protein
MRGDVVDVPDAAEAAYLTALGALVPPGPTSPARRRPPLGTRASESADRRYDVVKT